MPRYKLIIEYDGGSFAGWQRQENGPSIQGAIEAAIEAFCGDKVTITGAGRTDSGVHALGQVAHADLTKDHEARTVRDAINFHLRPQPISILAAEKTRDGFNARFSATGRQYLYRILNRPAAPALDRGRVWHVGPALDWQAMHQAAQRLIGKHDFTTFRSAACQSASPVKTLDRLDVVAAGAEIHIHAAARSFLHNQVRSLAGSLKLVGDGRWTGDDLVNALEARNRAACGPVAPAAGLYLMAVDYAGNDQDSANHQPNG